LTIINNISPSETEILACTDQNKDRDNLWNQYKPFYEEKRKQSEVGICDRNNYAKRSASLPFRS
jgi:hypothetical protein